MNERIDVAVIGAGVVGAAVAQRLAKKGRLVWVLEAGPRPAEGITSRNSGVIHSGLYYKPGSLKATTCVRGNRLLYEWCSQHHVPFQRTGKIITAVARDEVEYLERLSQNAQTCDAPGLSLITERELRSLEPAVRGVAGILCQETGIVDAAELTRSLLLDAESNGAMVLMESRVTAIDWTNGGYLLRTARGEVGAATVVNAAGLYADEIAGMAGITGYAIHPCRGDYFSFRSKVNFRHLLYPVKRPEEPGLGIHLTIDLAGRYRFGPDTEYVTNKEDFSPAEGKLENFRQSAERMLGPIDPSQLSYDTCGIRPKLRGPGETEEKDFVIREDRPGFWNLIGIDSPGLTASLAIAERVTAT